MGNYYKRDNKKSGGRKSFGGRRDGGRPAMHKATCAECGNDCEIPFRPTGTKPVFCSMCFGKQQDNRGGRRDRRSREDRQMYDVVCDKCEKNCQVPFKPTAGKPLLCDDCFGKNRDRGRSRNSGEIMEQIKMLNDKIDKIMSLLDSKTSVKKTKVEKEVKKKAAVKKTATKKPVKKKILKKAAAKKTTKKTTKKAAAKKKK